MDARISPADVLKRIERILAHEARISVDVDGTKVTVTGAVASGVERIEAARAIWSVAGVTAVDNELAVERDGAPHRYVCPDTAAL